MKNLYAEKIRTNYENFIAECPHCKKENIFNRVSDLKTVEPIDFREVECFKCGRSFSINGDTINERHEYLIFDCYELLELKKYMYCIINLCQAYESFFLKGMEIKLLWEPWKEKVFERNTDTFNKYSTELHKKIKDYTYSKFRNVFFDLYLKNKSFHSQNEIQDYINKMDCFAKIEPTDKNIQKYHNIKTRDLFLDLKRLTINEMRNKVAHKYGFRPTEQDVKKHLKEVRRIIFVLQERLKINHKISYYN